MSRFHQFLKSFVYAWQGIKVGFQGRNMKIHGAVGVLVISVGIISNLEIWQWALVYILIGLVLAGELFNSSIESLADYYKQKLKLDYTATRDTRDLAAAAVLVLALTAAVVGILIFSSALL